MLLSGEKVPSRVKANGKKRATSNHQQPVTSQPQQAASSAAASSNAVAAAAPAPTASGDAREAKALSMMHMLVDTRQQISQLRLRTENALAYVQQMNAERRQQLHDIQLAKERLNQLHAQMAKTIALNTIGQHPSDTAAAQSPRPTERPAAESE